MSEVDSERERLVRLIRRVARDVAYEIIDEHLDGYEHEEKPAEDFELGGLDRGKSKNGC
jgi:hypothetical protein